MPAWIVLRVVFGVLLAAGGAQPPNAAHANHAQREMLSQLDHHAQSIRDLTTDFVEEKFTPLLKKPLVSKGRVYIKGERTRWQTITPRESTLFTDASQVAIYFPARATMELYPIDQRLRALLVSPVPRVATLRRHFDIEITEADTPEQLHLRLTPKDDALREFVEELRVTVNVRLGLATRIDMTDPEGDRTVLTFENVRTNVGLADKDVERRVPPDTTIVRPLEADALSGGRP